VVALGAILVSLVPVGRGANRSVYAALFAVVVAWALRAGIDWDWEMPVVTGWVFAVGGAGLARKRKSTERAQASGPPSGLRAALGAFAVAPGSVFLSERRLEEATAAFSRGDCGEAMDAAAASISALEMRAEPYQVLGLCQVERGRYRLAIRALEEAVERDPDNWRYVYSLALTRGAAGLDPGPAARRARRLHPLAGQTRELVQEIRRGDGDLRLRMRRLARNERLAAVR
jgi:tetratricopeptide (TPR) repeat protein